MNEEVEDILFKLKEWTANKEDILRLKEIADQGDTKASLNYGICLFVGHLIDENRNEASKYFEKVYLNGTIEELNELASFYDEVGGPAYKNMSDMCVARAIDMFRKMDTQKQLLFIKKYAKL